MYLGSRYWWNACVCKIMHVTSFNSSGQPFCYLFWAFRGYFRLALKKRRTFMFTPCLFADCAFFGMKKGLIFSTNENYKIYRQISIINFSKIYNFSLNINIFITIIIIIFRKYSITYKNYFILIIIILIVLLSTCVYLTPFPNLQRD